jgi:hypothetical protein
MLFFALAISLVLLQACVADVPVNSTTQSAAEHRPNVNYYAVAQPAFSCYGLRGENCTYEEGTAPAVDAEVYEHFRGTIPEDALLQIMDANNADFAHGDFMPYNRNVTHGKIRWYPRSNSTFNGKLFIHTTRCYDGTDGAPVQASTGTGATYKKCALTYTDMDVGKTFPQPPYLCQETCDKDASCVAYVINGAGTLCWTMTNSGGSAFASYYRITS